MRAFEWMWNETEHCLGLRGSLLMKGFDCANASESNVHD